MAYFPYTADGVYTYINDVNGKEWTIRPYTAATSTHTFPEVISESYVEGVPQWENMINAEFNADGISNVYRTSQMADIGTTSKGTFDFHFMCKIRMSADEGYGGSLNSLKCDTATIFSLLSDTMTFVINSKYDNRNSGHAYDVPNAVMHIVKGHGLTDFSLDGQSTWRLVEKNP